jgi:hypothetical protein
MRPAVPGLLVCVPVADPEAGRAPGQVELDHDRRGSVLDGTTALLP